MNNKKKYSKYSVNIVPVGRKLKREVSVSEFAKALTNEQLFYVVETWFNNLMRQGWKEGLELGEHLSADHPTIQGVIVNAIAAIVTVMAKKQYTDARNNRAIELCQEMAKCVRDDKLQPFV